MKKLLLMRHGDYTDVFLNATGRLRVDAAAEAMAAAGLVPDVILHSPLPRAAETATRVADVFNRVAGKKIPVQENRALALGRFTWMDQLLARVDDTAATVLAVTHQPNVEQLSEDLGQRISPYTAEVAVFESDVKSWQDLAQARMVRKI